MTAAASAGRGMSPALRKLALTAHVTTSVGWLGAVGAFLALAVTGAVAADALVARAMYLAMARIGWWVLVPLSLASLATGVVQALGTSWGLVRHYWVVIKLAMTVPATALLLLHMRPIDHMARVAATSSVSGADFANLRTQLVVDAGAALMVLLVTTALSVYKPRGLTPFGQAQDGRARTLRP